MARKLIDLKVAKRPPNSRQIIKDVFSRVDCLACGICCRETNIVAIVGSDPGNQFIRQHALARFPNRITSAPSGGFSVTGDDGCSFLEDPEDGNACAIYTVRPAMCAVFPFTIIDVGELNNGTGQPVMEEKVCITTGCPPVRELEDKGIHYVELLDVMSQEYLEGAKQLSVEVPILSQSFYFLSKCFATGVLQFPDPFVKGTNGPIFPIA